MRLEFSVAGDVQLNRDILRVSSRALDMRPAFMRVLGLWRSETVKQFDTEGRHASGGWAPLAWSTLQRKRRGGGATISSTGQVAITFGGFSSRILVDSGALERSLTVAGDANEIARVSASELDYGSKVPYARFHQLGTSRMPQRRPVAFTETARRETIKIVQRYLITGEVAP